MALVGNRSLLLKSPGRFLSGTVGLLRSNFNQHGMMRSGVEEMGKQSGIPYGHLSPSAWVLPQRGGAMSCFTGVVITFDQNDATLAGGVNLEGTTTITFDTPPALLNLVANLTGTTSITFTVPDATLGGAASLTGTTSITFASPAALLGGIASVEGSTTISFGQNTATLTAIGYMSGPGPVEGLTTQTIADAVWAKLLAAGYTPEQLLSDLAKIHGLVEGTNLVVNASSRSAGDISQTIVDSGGTVTVTRV